MRQAAGHDFVGERDLGHYLDLCQEQRLAVFLRVGPYICAEWNYGGYPPYLRDEPGPCSVAAVLPHSRGLAAEAQ